MVRAEVGASRFLDRAMPRNKISRIGIKAEPYERLLARATVLRAAVDRACLDCVSERGEKKTFESVKHCTQESCALHPVRRGVRVMTGAKLIEKLAVMSMEEKCAEVKAASVRMSQDEEQRLAELIDDGYKVAEIARIMNRPLYAVRKKVTALRLARERQKWIGIPH